MQVNKTAKSIMTKTRYKKAKKKKKDKHPSLKNL